jgi:FkbM family methyltransferase
LAEEPRLENTVAIQMALGNTTGEVEMFVETANHGMSSSVLEPGSHLESYPQITFDTKEKVKIDKLDNLEFDRSKFNALNLDVQGYELEVLKGAANTLDTINIIFTEVNFAEVYKGCGKLVDIDEFLRGYGFGRFFSHLYESVGYGDAIYIKK